MNLTFIIGLPILYSTEGLVNQTPLGVKSLIEKYIKKYIFLGIFKCCQKTSNNTEHFHLDVK